MSDIEKQMDAAARQGLIPKGWREIPHFRIMEKDIDRMCQVAAVDRRLVLIPIAGLLDEELLHHFSSVMKDDNCKGILIPRSFGQKRLPDTIEAQVMKLRAVSLRNGSTIFGTLRDAISRAEREEPNYTFEYVSGVTEDMPKGSSVADYIVKRNSRKGNKTLFICESVSSFSRKWPDVFGVMSYSWKILS